MKAKKLISIMLALILLFAIVACASEPASETPAPTPAPNDSNEPTDDSEDTGTEELHSNADPVTLRWLIASVGDAPPDAPEVMDAINEKLQEFLPGTSLEITFVPFGEYDQRFTLEAAGGNYDIAWFGWMQNLLTEVGNGALMPLNDLIDRYGQDLRREIPEFMFANNTVRGNIYLIANNQQAASTPIGFQAPTELIEKHMDVDAFIREAEAWTSTNRFFPTPAFMDVLEEYAQNCMDAGDLMLGYQMHFMGDGLFFYNAWYLGRAGGPIIGRTRAWDDSSRVYNYLDYQEDEIEYWERIRKWNDMGFIRRDAMTVEDWQAAFADFPQGNGYIATTHAYDKYRAHLVSEAMGFDVTILPIGYFRAPIGTNPTNTANGILANAPNPERAMQFMNLINSERGAEIYNMIVWGIEGKHWEFTDQANGMIETFGYVGQVTPEQPYGLPMWVVGNTVHAYINVPDADPDMNRYFATEFNFNAMSLPLMGFVFDTTEFVAETTALSNVWDEFREGLRYGAFADVRATVIDRNERFEAAGGSRMTTELQRQIDEFKASN